VSGWDLLPTGTLANASIGSIDVVTFSTLHVEAGLILASLGADFLIVPLFLLDLVALEVSLSVEIVIYGVRQKV
jgi:hypothetical protein